MKSSKNSARRFGNSKSRHSLRKIVMKLLCSGEQMRAADETVISAELGSAKDYGASTLSSAESESARKADNGNIEEAELSLRETSSLNYEEARALLGRIEYQKANVEAALRVFEGIDINAIAPKMKLTLCRREERHKRRSKSYTAPPPPMSIHAVNLLFEAMFLKAKSLQHLGRFQEAAQSCKVILDIVESSLPEGLPENFAGDSKLNETLSRAVELLPELWKLADSPREAILSYRRALLNHWKLDAETTARIQKEFAVFLLYSGDEATPPNLRSQLEGSFIPRSSIEESILLLMILLRKVNLKRIEWDASILEHLSFALSIVGDLRPLAKQLEELLPQIMDRKELYFTLALSYYGAGEHTVALDLLRKLFRKGEDQDCVPALLIASKICGENLGFPMEGIDFARRAVRNLGECDQLESTANFVLGISLSEHSRTAITDSERTTKQSEALQALETAKRTTKVKDPYVLYHLALENAEQRKLGPALFYAKSLLKLEGGSNLEGWLLLARIVSAQKRFSDAETIINAALDQTGKWEQGVLLRTKAKLHIAQGQLNNAVETYTQLLALLQVQTKSFGSSKKLQKGYANRSRDLELEIWHDLAHVYISLSQWRDAETCLSRSKAIVSYSAVRWHAYGVLYRKKGLHEEALKAFMNALDINPAHVPSLISKAEIFQEQGNRANPIVRSLLMEALRIDRTNPSAWYNLGMSHRTEGSAASLVEASECFQAATFLEETAPIEPFR